MLLGAGTAYTFAGHWALRLDFIYLNHLEEPFFNKTFNVELVTAGISYAF